jgi:uncharacterized protein YjbJ (UPF0337 family)
VVCLESYDDKLRGEKMDKDRVKGKIDEVVGSAKRNIGGRTGSINMQAEGIVQQLKGNAETGVGKLKDAVRDGRDNAARQNKTGHKAKYVDREVIVVDNRNMI